MPLPTFSGDPLADLAWLLTQEEKFIAFKEKTPEIRRLTDEEVYQAALAAIRRIVREEQLAKARQRIFSRLEHELTAVKLLQQEKDAWAVCHGKAPFG